VAKIPRFVKAYRKWGGIKHFCVLRLFVLPRVFPGEDVISLDGDMIINAGLGEIERAVGRDLYFLSRSSCLASIPAGSGFFELFEEHLLRAHANPEAYARDVMGFSDVQEFLDPIRFEGSNGDLSATFSAIAA